MRATVGILAAVLCAGSLTGCAAVAAVAPVGHAELQLIGDWTGVVDSHGDGVTDMTVTDASDDGSAFGGELTFSAGGSDATEPVRAEMTPHGHLVATIGDDASIEVHIVDPATLDYCFIRYGTDFVYSCGRLIRQE